MQTHLKPQCICDHKLAVKSSNAWSKEKHCWSRAKAKAKKCLSASMLENRDILLLLSQSTLLRRIVLSGFVYVFSFLLLNTAQHWKLVIRTVLLLPMFNILVLLTEKNLLYLRWLFFTLLRDSKLQSTGSQPFQVCGPVNKRTGVRGRRLHNLSMPKMLHIHRAGIKSFYQHNVRYNQCEGWACLLLESRDVRGSIHHNAQIKPPSTLNLLLDFIFMATRASCLPQNTLSNYILCTTGSLRGNFHAAIISNT